MKNVALLAAVIASLATVSPLSSIGNAQTTQPTAAVTMPATSMASTQPASSEPSAEATTEPTSRPSVAVDQTTPRGTLKVFQTAMTMGDAGALADTLMGTTPEEKKVIDLYSKMTAAKTNFRRTLLTKFPPPGVDVKADDSRQLQQAMKMIDQLDEAVTGEDATIGLKDRPPVAMLKKVDGKWKLPFGAVFGTPKNVPQAMKFLKFQEMTFEDLKTDIDGGKFKTIDDVQDAYKAKVEAFSQQMEAETTTRPGPIGPEMPTSEPTSGPSTMPSTTPSIMPSTKP